MNDKYYKKYLKYKNKYLKLIGGASEAKGTCDKWRKNISLTEQESICKNQRNVEKSSPPGFWNCTWNGNKCVDFNTTTQKPTSSFTKSSPSFPINDNTIEKLIKLIDYFKINQSRNCEIIKVTINVRNKEISLTTEEKKKVVEKTKKYVTNPGYWLGEILITTDATHLKYIKRKRDGTDTCFTAEFMKDYLLYLLENVLQSDNEIDKIYAIGIIFIGFLHFKGQSIQANNDYLNKSKNSNLLKDGEDVIKIETIIKKLTNYLNELIELLIKNTIKSNYEKLIENIEKLNDKLKEDLPNYTFLNKQQFDDFKKLIDTKLQEAKQKQTFKGETHSKMYGNIQNLEKGLRFKAALDDVKASKEEEAAAQAQEEARRVEEEARRVKEEELKKANEKRDMFVHNYSMNKIEDKMKEIKKKAKKIVKNKDKDINVDDLSVSIDGNVNIINEKGVKHKKRKELVKYLEKIIEWNKYPKNIVEAEKKESWSDFDIFKEIYREIINDINDTNYDWKKLYDDSKKYAEDYLWWREVFLGNIRS